MNTPMNARFIIWVSKPEPQEKNSKQKSTDIVDLSITKNFIGNTLYLKLTNLLNERYEKPANYSQDGRRIRFGFKRSF